MISPVPPSRHRIQVHRALTRPARRRPVLAFVILWRLPHATSSSSPPWSRCWASPRWRCSWTRRCGLASGAHGPPVAGRARGVRRRRSVPLILATAPRAGDDSDAFIYLRSVQRSHGRNGLPSTPTAPFRRQDSIGTSPTGSADDRLSVSPSSPAAAPFAERPPARNAGHVRGASRLLRLLACRRPRAPVAGATRRRLAWVATGVSAGRLCSAIVFGVLWTRGGDRVAVAAFTTALLVVLLAAIGSRGMGSAVAS